MFQTKAKTLKEMSSMTIKTSRHQFMKKTAVVSLAALLSACALSPEPFSQEEFNSKAKMDREALFKDQEPLTTELTLEDALARALKYNLERRSKMMEEALALGQLDLDQYELLPKITANAGYLGRSEFNATQSSDLYTHQITSSNPSYSADRSAITADLGLTWNILDFGVSYFTAHQNADRALIASEKRRKTLQNLAQEVRFTYWQASAAQILKDKVIDIVRLAELSLQDAERVENENLRNPLESLRTQKTLLESMRQLEGIEQELISAKAKLAALINISPNSNFVLAIQDEMPIPQIDLPIEQLEELALSNNPDLREQDYLSRISIEESKKEILKLLPGITFSFSRQYDHNSYLIENRWNEAGAKITFNLLNLLSAPDRIKFSESSEQVAETRRLALRMAILTQVHVVSNQVVSAAKQYRRADKLWNVEERLAATTAIKQQGGTQSQIEKITTQTSAIAAELRRYQTYAELQSAFGKLQATIGADPVAKDFAQTGVQTISQSVPVLNTDETDDKEVSENSTAQEKQSMAANDPFSTPELDEDGKVKNTSELEVSFFDQIAFWRSKEQ
jgi:outer membrane protein TolC